MKAWVLDKPAPVESRPLVLTDVPVPQSAADEVLVQMPSLFERYGMAARTQEDC